MTNCGAWEVVVDKAALEVSKYMSMTTKPFLPESELAKRMLALLDKSTLRDVLVERNFNSLCGMIGCNKAPQGGRCRTMKTLQDDERSDNDSDDDDDMGVPGDEEKSGVFRMYAKYREGRGNATPRETPVTGGIEISDRFCSATCAEQFGALLGQMQESLVYGRADVVHAVSGLFPNMSLGALQRLAGAESTAVADIREKNTPRQPTPSSTSAVSDEAMVKMREVLDEIQAVDHVWGHEMQKPKAVSVLSKSEQRMPMPLMVYDWLFTASTPATKNIFWRLCRRNAQRCGGSLSCWISDRHDSSLYAERMQPILLSCLQKTEVGLEQTQEEERPPPDPAQQQRLSLLASHLFSSDTTATLSRLLFFDETTLERVWSVWQTSGLLFSLWLPFALPGGFAAGGPTPVTLFLALVITAATGLCVSEVWAEWLQDDNALAEVLNALGVTAEELSACVRILVLE